MKIQIQNFGPISNAEIEQKSLTVFVGPNGSGKTWTAYLIACLFGPYMCREYSQKYEEEQVNERYSTIEEAFERLYDEGSTTIDLEAFSRENFYEYMSNVSKLLPRAFNGFIGSRKISFSSMEINTDFGFDLGELLKHIKKKSLKRVISVNKDGEALLTIESPKDDPFLYIYTRSSEELDKKMPRKVVRGNIASSVFIMIHTSFFGLDYYLPAERTGLSYFMPFQSPSKSMDEIPEAEEIESDEVDDEDNSTEPAYPVVRLFTLYNEVLSSKKRSSRLENASKNQNMKDFIRLSEILENSILGGSLEFKDLTDNRSDMQFHLSNMETGFEILPLSSGIKDLTPLIIYLRYYAYKRQIIVIDEPEMNLHPEAQIKMMELLGMMVNLGLKVIVTTHSPYLVDHIANLTKAYKLKQEGKKNLEESFKLQNDLSFLNPNDVSVYLFDNGNVTDIFNENGIVNWQTFGDVSDYVGRLYYELSDK